MALKKRELDPHIPATSQPAHCRKETGGKKCGKPAHHWIPVRTEIMGKEIKIQLPYCDAHYQEIESNAAS